MCSCSVVFSSSIRFRFIRGFLQIERMQESSIWFPLSVCCRFQACWTWNFYDLHVRNGKLNVCMYMCVCVCLVYRLLCLKITQKWHETTLTTPNIPKQHSLQIPSRERIHPTRKSSTQKCQKLGNVLVFSLVFFGGYVFHFTKIMLLYPLASQMLNCWTRAPPVAVASVRGKQSEVLHLPGNLGFSKKSGKIKYNKKPRLKNQKWPKKSIDLNCISKLL